MHALDRLVGCDVAAADAHSIGVEPQLLGEVGHHLRVHHRRLAHVDARAVAVLAIADTLKAGSLEAVTELRRLGLEVAMLTGDNRRTAEAVARAAGIERVFADIRPDGKAAVVRGLQAEALVSLRSQPITPVYMAPKSRFWEQDDQIYGGRSWTDQDIGQILYPSHGFGTSKGVLVGYFLDFKQTMSARAPAERQRFPAVTARPGSTRW